MSGPEFGPGGYLPPKAAKRARKIVLREQMGFGWPLAAVAASLLVLIAGGAFLLQMSRPPAYPYVAFAPLTDVPAGGAATLTAPDTGWTAHIVRAGGGVRAFAGEPGDPTWGPESGRLETEDAAWRPDGTLVHRVGSARESLVPLRSVVHDGVIYVDVANLGTPPPPALGDRAPVCTDE